MHNDNSIPEIMVAAVYNEQASIRKVVLEWFKKFELDNGLCDAGN